MRWVGIALVLAGCAGAGDRAGASVAARDRARLVLESRCGQCHIGTYDSARPRALAVFDLSETDWSARASDAQLVEMNRRMEVGLGPDGEELGVTDEERAIVRAFVDEELARRASR